VQAAARALISLSLQWIGVTLQLLKFTCRPHATEILHQGLDGGKLSLVRVRKQHDIIGVEGDRMLSLSAVASILARESITLSTMPAY
jgi:hypothetical protein